MVDADLKIGSGRRRPITAVKRPEAQYSASPLAVLLAASSIPAIYFLDLKATGHYCVKHIIGR
jgi:hypothetical protein